MAASYREKFRIRYYNNDASFIRLEKKVKDGAVGYKQSACITKEMADQLIQKKYDCLADASTSFAAGILRQVQKPMHGTESDHHL